MLKKNTFRDYNRALVLKHPRIAINGPRITINNYMRITWVITWQLHVKEKHSAGYSNMRLKRWKKLALAVAPGFMLSLVRSFSKASFSSRDRFSGI